MLIEELTNDLNEKNELINKGEETQRDGIRRLLRILQREGVSDPQAEIAFCSAEQGIEELAKRGSGAHSRLESLMNELVEKDDLIEEANK